MKLRKDFVLEVCVDSVESAIAAKEGGATRLELCSNLVIGGTTPGRWLFEEVRRRCDLPVHVLVRPRFGDFCYTDYEFGIIRSEVRMFRELGAEGVVIGILRPDGMLNLEQMGILIEEAGDMSVTLHRAFDVCADPYLAFEQAKRLGIQTVLTSGQRDHCLAGKELLRGLVEREDGRITVQAGGGVNAQVIRELAPYTGAHAFHMSGKVELDSAMEYRREGVSMGLPSLSEFTIFRTDPDKIREARRALEELRSE